MYRIKQLPEDFIVRELMELRLEDAGRYSYYLLKKTGSNTVDAVGRVAKRLGAVHIHIKRT
jgi:tRNA(Glu) U13 pseudouridine synthase TruD